MRLSMRTRRAGLSAVAVLALALMLAGCGGSTDETTVGEPNEPAVTTTEAPAAAPESTPTEPAPDGGEPVELTLADVFDPIATEPTESGPRPLLAWEAIEGADLYQVVVLGADGEPYWAWSGTETEIHVGGNPEPQALGAWVHESMTWTVSAHGPEGQVLGLSSPAGLEP